MARQAKRVVGDHPSGTEGEDLPVELAEELERLRAAYVVRRAVVLVWLALAMMAAGFALSCLVQGYRGWVLWWVIVGVGAAGAAAFLWYLERLGRRYRAVSRKVLVDGFSGRS